RGNGYRTKRRNMRHIVHQSESTRTLGLALTLEEHERILGQPLMENPPYLYQGNYPSWDKVAKLLRVSKPELVKRKMGRSEVDGIPLVYLEERMELLSKNGNWDAFNDVLGLDVYGIVIFSHLNDYVDLATIDVFLACQERGKNLIATVLANTYYTIHSCHDKKR
ncbi:hypothetical protein CR513_42037, partial [Mucuna pruriens]